MTSRSLVYSSVIIGVSGLLACLLLCAQTPEHPHVAIAYIGSTNSVAGRGIAMLRITNASTQTLCREEVCTLYYDVTPSVQTNTFYSLLQNSTLSPGSSEVVEVELPQCSGSWQVSFTFSVSQNSFSRLVEVLRNTLGLANGTHQLFVFLGPKLPCTNP